MSFVVKEKWLPSVSSTEFQVTFPAEAQRASKAEIDSVTLTATMSSEETSFYEKEKERLMREVAKVYTSSSRVNFDN